LTRFVLDASVVLAWCFEDKVETLAELALDSLQAGEASVPPIWPAEVGNALIDICINNAIIGAEEAQHLCPDRRVALICWRIDAGERWPC
jgi:hypothetical protein